MHWACLKSRLRLGRLESGFGLRRALVELASAAVERVPQLWLTFVLDAILQLDQPVEHGLGTRRASGNVDVDRDDAVPAVRC